MSAASAAAVASAFGLGSPHGPPVFAARGELGRVWRLGTTRGTWAVKELLVPADEAAAASDVDFQLAALKAGLPLPRPHRTLDGRVVLPADEAASAFCGLRVYEWADLVPGEMVSGAELGAVAARLHLVEHGCSRPAEAWFSEPVGEQAWHAMAGEARRAEAAWAAGLEGRLPELIALDSIIRPADPSMLTTCHRDLNVENVARSAGGEIIILDWENSGPAPLERALASVVSDLACDVDLAAALAGHAAYLAAGGPARLSGPGDFAVAAAAQGHLIQLYSRRALDSGEMPGTRARSRRRLDQILSKQLTMTGVERFLDLLS
jgi:Ser/Thr protein kinase RdoA (MazF antagonist)